MDAKKNLALRFLNDMSNRGPALFEDFGIITNDFIWWAGSSGQYTRPQIVKRMGQVGKLFARPNNRTIHNVIAKGDPVAVELCGDIPLKQGARYQNTYLNLFFFCDGRISQVKVCCDTTYANTTLRA